MLEVTCFPVSEFQMNAYLVVDQKTRVAAVIDVGIDHSLVVILSNQHPVPDLKYVFITHGHVDHAGGLVHLQKQFSVKTFLPLQEKSYFETLPKQGTYLGHPQLDRPCGIIDQYLEDGDEISIGESILKVLLTSGHTPGHACYYTEQELFSGDCLFAGSIGRTDTPGGNSSQMRESLRRFGVLPTSLKVYPGHGPSTLLKNELANNYFLGFLRHEGRGSRREDL